MNNPIAQLNLYGWAFMDYNKVIKNRPLKMESKQVQIHIKKLGAVVSKQSYSNCVKRCCRFIFGGRLVEQRKSPTSTYLAYRNNFICLYSRHVHHQISTRKTSVSSSAKVGSAISLLVVFYVGVLV